MILALIGQIMIILVIVSVNVLSVQTSWTNNSIPDRISAVGRSHPGAYGGQLLLSLRKHVFLTCCNPIYLQPSPEVTFNLALITLLGIVSNNMLLLSLQSIFCTKQSLWGFSAAFVSFPLGYLPHILLWNTKVGLQRGAFSSGFQGFWDATEESSDQKSPLSSSKEPSCHWFRFFWKFISVFHIIA